MDDIQRLWNALPHPDGTVIRWMARGRSSGGRVQGDYARTAGELRTAIQTFPNLNFYVCPNPTWSRAGVRHTAAQVSHWSWLLLDIDPIHEDAPDFNPQAALGRAVGLLNLWLDIRNPLHPLILDSGRGAQAWFRLNDEPMYLDWTEYGEDGAEELRRREATRTMRFWLTKLDETLGEIHGCRVDTTTSDLPRPMRCPGTVNLKTGRLAYIVEDGAPHPDLAKMLVDAVPFEVFAQPDPTGPAEGRSWHFATPHLTNKARTFIFEGWTEPGRHEVLWHTAKRLQEAGVSREETRKALRHGNLQCLPRPLDDKDVEHALDTAFGHVL
jgi:hypothetical protein